MKKLISIFICTLILFSIMGYAFVSNAEVPPPSIVFQDTNEMFGLFNQLSKEDSSIIKYLEENNFNVGCFNSRNDVENLFSLIFRSRLPFVEGMSFSRMSIDSHFTANEEFDPSYINISFSDGGKDLYFFSISTTFNSAEAFLDENKGSLNDVSEGFPEDIRVFAEKTEDVKDGSILFFMDLGGYFVHARLYNIKNYESALEKLKSISFSKSFILSYIEEGKNIACYFNYDNYIAKKLLGDINNDGKVTSNDARLALRVSARLNAFMPETKLLADVDSDLKITAGDARLILRFSANIEKFNKADNRFLPIYEDEIREFEREVIAETNVYRKNLGLSQLIENPELSRIARFKSMDMRDNNYFDHKSPTYGSPFDMMKSFGITYMFAGENIGYGYTTPKDVVKAWWESPGHKANIVKPNYNYIGVGYVEEGNFWTQMFTD